MKWLVRTLVGLGLKESDSPLVRAPLSGRPVTRE